MTRRLYRGNPLAWLRRISRLGTHSRRQASSSVWQVLATDGDTGYLPAWPGAHRHGVAPGTDTQRKAWGLPVDPWPNGPADAWGDALVMS